MDLTYWRTRDGEEIDFLVETSGRVTPVEVKLGTPNGHLLPSLARLQDSRWNPGRVISLVHRALGATPATPADGWLAASPEPEPFSREGSGGAADSSAGRGVSEARIRFPIRNERRTKLLRKKIQPGRPIRLHGSG